MASLLIKIMEVISKMPIPENQLNISGLAQLAGQQMPRLDLPLSGITATPNQPIFQGAEVAAQLQQQRNQMQYQGMLEQFKQGQENQRNNTTAQAGMLNAQTAASGRVGAANALAAPNYDRNAIQAQNNLANQDINQQNADTRLQGVVQQGQYQQGQLGIGQQNADSSSQTADANTQKAAVDQAKQDLAQKVQMSKEQLNKRGAAGASLIMGLNANQGDPKAQLNWITNTWLPQAKANGWADPKELQQVEDAANKGDVNSINTMAHFDTYSSGMVSDKKNAQNGILGAQGLTPTNTTQQQGTSMYATASQTGIAKTLANFNPDIFTYSGIAQSKEGSIAEKMPDSIMGFIQQYAPDAVNKQIDESKKLADAQANFQTNTLSNMMNTLSMQKGVRFNQKTLDALKAEMPTIGSDGPGQAFTKLITLNQRMQAAEQFSNQLLNKGLTPNDKSYQEQLNNYVLNEKNNGDGKFAFTANDSNGKPVTEHLSYEDISKIAKEHNQSFSQAFQGMLKYQAQQSQPQQPAGVQQ